MPHAQLPLLGAHISVAGGFNQAIHQGESIGCTALQIFTKSNRQWFAKPITQEDADRFKEAWDQSPIASVIAHAAYLINLGSSNPETVKKSTAALADELKRCDQLGIPYLVLHPGSNGHTNQEQGLEQIITNLNTIFETTPSRCSILLETMAGQGNNLCYRFEQIAAIYDASSYKERLGVCVDTCHLFAAGYDIRTPEAYQKTWDTFDATLGLQLLKVIHINDSKKGIGSRVDRHEAIGKGEIGLEGFRLLCNDRRFDQIPKIIETPKESLDDDARNLAVIRNLLK